MQSEVSELLGRSSPARASISSDGERFDLQGTGCLHACRSGFAVNKASCNSTDNQLPLIDIEEGMKS
jgi:hypothetical protein